MSEVSQLSEEQRTLLEMLLREEGQNPDLVLPIPPRPDADTAPLSASQERMWFARQMSAEDAAYNIQTALRITGPLNVERLQRALDQLAERHETLRTSFEKRGDDVLQRVHPARAVALAMVSVPSAEELRSIVDAEAARIWDLTVSPSLRVMLIHTGEWEYVLLLGMHHILSDGWSVGVLTRDLWRLYDDPAGLDALPLQYADYAVWERRKAARDAEEHTRFWREQLRDAVDYLELPLDHPRSVGTAVRGALHTLSLSAERAQSVRRCAINQGVSPFAVCLAAFNLLLCELSGATDMLVGTPVANRERSDLENLIGYFANTVVLRSEWGPKTSFGELVGQVRDVSLGVLAHQGFPFDKVVELANPPRVAGANPLFQVFFAFQKYTLNKLHADSLDICEFEYGSRVTRFDLELHVWESGNGGIDAVFVYAADLFDADTISHWSARWMEILRDACAKPGAFVASLLGDSVTRKRAPEDAFETTRAELEALAIQLPEVTQSVALIHDATEQVAERIPLGELLPAGLCRTTQAQFADVKRAEPESSLPCNPRMAISHGAPFELDPSGPMTIGELLTRTAAEHPDAGCRFLPSNVFVPYPRLLEDASRVQTWLGGQGVQAGSFLLLQLTDERDILTCFWGAVLAGAVPFILPLPDGFHPDAGARLGATWKHLGCPPVVACQPVPEWAAQATVLLWDAAQWASCGPAPHPHQANPDAIAFFVQSSGTTGQPKCVPVRHRNVLSRAMASIAFTGIDASRVYLNWLPLDHIGSISDWHIRCMATGGNPIYCNKQPILADPLVWLDWIEQYQVTDTWAPNFAYNLLIEALASTDRRWDLSRLRACLTAAEGIASSTLDKLEDLLADFGFSQGVFQPAFGMAEVCSGVTYHRPEQPARVPRRSPRGESRLIVDCGAPIAGVSIRIVDEEGELLHEEEAGHFQLHGAPLFSGYYELPEHNAERFTADGWFDTGDFAFLVDGHLFVTGREAGEIVYNGRKYSCEDIERAMAEIPGVRAESVVVCSVRQQDAQQVILFFSPLSDEAVPELARRVAGRVTARFGLRVDFVVPVEPQEIVRTSIGKLQRSVLARQFGEGHFQARVVSMQGEAMLPDCFFRPDWKRSSLPFVTKPGHLVHMIADADGLAESAAMELRDAGTRVEWIKEIPADGLPEDVNLVDFSCFRSSVEGSDDMERSLATAGYLRVLLQALAKNPPSRCRLTFITAQAQATGREDAVWCADAVVSGILKSAAQEFSPWLQCRHVDVSSPTDARQLGLLADEILSDSDDVEVAYRGLRRLVPAMARADLRRAELKADFFNPGDFYLISGGMGQMGRILCERLSLDFGLHLLLVGRSALDDEQRRFLSLYPNAAYAVADVADADVLRKAVEQCEAQWCTPLAGVLHLAGVGNWEAHQRTIDTHRIVGIGLDEFAEQFRAKIEGTRRLYELVKARQGAKFIAASSVLGIFGGSGFAAYSAANSYLHAFCCARRKQGDSGVHCFHWAPWVNIGMSRGQDPVLAAAQGFLSLSADEGWLAFLAGLTRGQSDLVIGLDPKHPRSGISNKRITLFYTVENSEKVGRVLSAAVEPLLRRSGQSGVVELKHVATIPDDPSELLNEASEQAVLPPAMREVESQLLAIFKTALSLKDMSPDDNFFELGAHSLLLARLEVEIQSRVSSKIALLDLFRFPSVRALACHIATSESEPVIPSTSPRQERNLGRDAVRQARERHRGRKI